jgi:hypothetical protein
MEVSKNLKYPGGIPIFAQICAKKWNFRTGSVKTQSLEYRRYILY